MILEINQKIFRSAAIFEISIKRFLLDKKTLLLFLAGLLPSIFAFLWGQSNNWSATIDEFRFNYVTLTDGLFINLIILFFSLIFAISTFKDEEESKTLSYLLTRPVTRLEIYVMKFLAFEAVTIPLITVCMFPSYVLMTMTLGSSGTIISEFALFYGTIILAILEVTFYGAIFMLLSVLLSKPLIPAFFIALFERWFLTGILAGIDLGMFVPSYHLGAIGNALMPYGPYVVEKASTGWQSLALLLLLSTVVLVFGILVMTNKDFP